MMAKLWKYIDEHPFLFVLGLLSSLGLIYYIVSLSIEFGANTSNKVAGIFTPLIVAAVTIYLSGRQHNIADAQRAVAEESKNIADAQREIAKQKIRLDLFDKRYSMYQEIFSLFDDFLHLNSLIDEFENQYTDEYCGNHLHAQLLLKDIEINKIDVHVKNEKMKRFLNKVEFLFSEEAKEQLRDLIETISSSLNEINVNSKHLLHNIDNLMENKFFVVESYRELSFIVNPYMDLSDIK